MAILNACAARNMPRLRSQMACACPLRPASMPFACPPCLLLEPQAAGLWALGWALGSPCSPAMLQLCWERPAPYSPSQTLSASLPTFLPTSAAHLLQFEKVLESYRRTSKQWSATLNRFAEVRMRGRKRAMVG